MSTKTTIPAQVRFKLSSTGGSITGDDLLLPVGASGVPKEVTNAEALVKESMERRATASRALTAAEEEARAAPMLDRSRDAAAAASGAELPSGQARLEVQAAVELELCQKRFNAEDQLLGSRQITYAHEVTNHHSEWLSRQDKLVADAEQTALKLLADLERAADELAAARSVRACLQDWPTFGGHLSHIRFYKPNERHQQRTREQAEEALVRADSGGFASKHSVARDLPNLLAATKFEIVGRTPHYIRTLDD
jgi:hypothetical protein